MVTGVPNMLCAVVVAAVISNVYGGYSYPKPSIPFELPNRPVQYPGEKDLNQGNSQEYQKTISYSVGIEDYSYLQQHNKERVQQKFQTPDSLVNPEQQNLKISLHEDVTSGGPITTKLSANIDTTVSAQSVGVEQNQREQSNLNAQSILNTENEAQLIRILDLQGAQNLDTELLKEPDFNNVQDSLPEQKLLNVHHNYNVQYDQITPQTLNEAVKTIGQPVLNLNQARVPLIAVQNTLDTQFTSPQLLHDPSKLISNLEAGLTSLPGVQNDLLLPTNNEPREFLGNIQNNNINLQNNDVPTPVVTKQITFHVPPPEIEEEPVVIPPEPPKKIYKILFIKLPNQEHSNTPQLQSPLYNTLGSPIEEKTIIYLLTKKPELSLPAVVPQQKVSDHEVFFVKYRDNSNVVPAEINNILNKNPTLEPTETSWK